MKKKVTTIEVIGNNVIVDLGERGSLAYSCKDPKTANDIIRELTWAINNREEQIIKLQKAD